MKKKDLKLELYCCLSVVCIALYCIYQRGRIRFPELECVLGYRPEIRKLKKHLAFFTIYFQNKCICTFLHGVNKYFSPTRAVALKASAVLTKTTLLSLSMQVVTDYHC